jgi:PAS domain S-box-containing protein
MKLRTILLTLSLLATVSTAVGAFYYFFSLREYEFAVARRQAASRAELVRNQLSTHLTENLNTVKALAGLSELRAALEHRSAATLEQANLTLDHFQHSLAVNVCYLMDHTGLVIATSNRGQDDSFLGDNYSFRPYFKNAIQGHASKYLALGTRSLKRGAYYSHPVWGTGGEPLGVVVIKSSIRRLEETVLQPVEGITILTGPYDVIFSTSRPDWLYKTLWRKTPQELKEVSASRQFGAGPWPWVGLTLEDQHLAVDQAGRRYMLYSYTIEDFDNWKVIHLRDLAVVSESMMRPLARTTGIIVLGICLFLGLGVYFLNRKARSEIARREAAEAELRSSEERYRFLYHNTPALLHSIDSEGRLVSVSDYWTEALGYEADEVIGRKLTDFLTPESRRNAEEKTMPQFFDKGQAKNISHRFVKKDGEIVEVLLSAIAERNDEGDIVRSLAVLSDVSALKRIEEELRLAQEKLSQYSKDLERQVRQRTRELSGLIEYTPAVVYMKDPQGRYVLVNSRWEEIFGMSKDAAKGKTVFDVFSKEVADQFRNNDIKVLNEKRPFQSEEMFPQDGGMHNYLSVRFPVLDEQGRVRRLCGISVDITDLKKAQDQLRRLSGSIMASQEKERTAIARELHDELGQVLTALRMDAVWLRDQLQGRDERATARARNMCDLIDRTISDVRHIATRLRPPVLDDLGLVDALEWHTTEFEKRTGIACVFNHGEVPALSEFTSIAAFRVAQEALTNVVRHADATSVDVTLAAVDGELIVAVVDNGSGFAVDDLTEQESLGIAGMRERAGLAYGKLDIRSSPGQGTGVYLRLPLDYQIGDAA